jgi:hypothetical protein
MFADENHMMESQADQWLDAMPVDELPPAAAARIEAACLARLHSRRQPLFRFQSPLLEALGFALALLLGSGYLLETLVRALAVYGVRLH